ncbi:protein kinase (macronuclear) [Tetrahymena thermophila SB210]|uniref:Protein kinase n=1 Tax=Tetrahymena thermophila (strain SB210) TaxID=312017 RepID=Q23EY3_TETTS|nr:protein kinase [Tetrahymena thermophila SB210]EAR95122.2 protein kinase [Tetrahymena thermophila SB210]|eukprot:XP_001015367.2 protein kinase [Tetrahymena thermophila SB210]
MFPSNDISNTLTIKKSSQNKYKFDQANICEEQKDQYQNVVHVKANENSQKNFYQSMNQNVFTEQNDQYFLQDEYEYEKISNNSESQEELQIDQFKQYSQVDSSLSNSFEIDLDLDDYFIYNKKINSLLKLYNYEIQKLISKGEIGFVFQAKNLKTQEEVAIKIINFQQFNYPYIDDLLKALEQNISEFQQKYQNNYQLKYMLNVKQQFIQDQIFIQEMEICKFNFNSTSLQLYFQEINSKKFKYPLQINFILACFLNELHEQNLTHLNLKPCNILVNMNGYIKISDFIASNSYYEQLQKFRMYLKYKNDDLVSPKFQFQDDFKKQDVFNLGHIMDSVFYEFQHHTNSINLD